jgi:MFS family permease
VSIPTGQLTSSFFIRAFQFAFWGAVGFFFPFINAYYRTIGLSGTEIGLIGTLSALTGAIGAVAWGLLHDRLGKSKLVFGGLCWGAILLGLLLAQLHEYAWILPVAALMAFFTGPVVSQVDSMTLKLLGPHHAAYGSHRVWGTIGFVITSAIGGFILQATGIRAIFIAFPLGMVIFWLVTLRLPDQTIYHGPDLLAGLGQMARNPHWMLLMGSVLVLWTAVLSMSGMIGVVVKDMGGSDATIGLIYTVAAFAEIPLLQGGPYILRRFGARRLILAAMVAYILRMVLYTLVVTPELVIAISLMQSITYCPFLIGAIALANELAPTELKSTSQGLLGMAMSLSNVVGGLAGGWLYDHTGQAGLFWVAAITSGVALVLYAGGTLRLRSTPADFPKRC